jgi:hypothetical protein
MRTATHKKLDGMYYDGVPEYIRDATRDKIVIVCDGAEHTITLDDVCHHYAYDACNITSGFRRLGDIVGDWRPVSNIAQECLNIFKVLNIEGLRKASKSYSDIMTPRF